MINLHQIKKAMGKKLRKKKRIAVMGSKCDVMGSEAGRGQWYVLMWRCVNLTWCHTRQIAIFVTPGLEICCVGKW